MNIFDAENAVMLLIDHQVGTMSWVGSTSFDEMKRNALMLARTASALQMPVVLTSSMEEHAQGPLLPELAEILPAAFEGRIRRSGVVNAMADAAFAQAVTQHNRRNIIVAGVTNDVCTVYPVLTLLEQGYNVRVVADAGGSPSAMGDALAIERMRAAGATVVGTNQLLAELAQDWSSEAGQKILPIIGAAMAAH